MPPSTPAPFGHVLTAMVTPFRQDGSLDLDAAQRVAEHLVDHGHDGIVVNGTTGESPTTTESEQDALIRAVREVVAGRAVVVAGAGSNDTAHTVLLAQQAEKAGADGLLVVTPYYNKPPQEGVRRHFLEVADATALPVMIYDIPGRTGTPVETETLVRLAEHERIVAVKDAKGDLYAGSWVMARSDLAFYSGDDALNLAWLAHGAAGMVSVVGHVTGELWAGLVTAVGAGDLDEARALYRQALPAVRGIMTRTQGAIMAKAALQLTGLLPSRVVRLPLVEATEEQVALLRVDLAEAGVL
jgi:4-hydroxy-tetrahydrodipicolinate synthase